jgi:cardiolipin synthase
LAVFGVPADAFWQSARFFWQSRNTIVASTPTTIPERAMTSQKTLFTNVHNFYANLVQTIPQAQERLSMMYFTFDDGEWAQRIAPLLAERAANGVNVRLLVDEFGLIADNPRHALRNHRLLDDLRADGVKVDIFRPHGNRLTAGNRLHTKICAVDNRTAFIGGSNIGDHYTTWDDYNLRLDGDLGGALHDIYDFINHHTPGGAGAPQPRLHLSRLFADDAQVWFTVPHQRRDIRRALLDLILSADKAIFIRNWYFIPDREILDALRSQAQHGVAVNVLLSHKTRVRPIDAANYIHGHKLAQSGGQVYRYTGGYMHAKVAWNNNGEVLFGSANMDKKALRDNFECSLTFRDTALTWELRKAFEADTERCILQTPSLFEKRSLVGKALSFTCNLASPWL